MGRYRKQGGSQNLTCYFTSGPADNSWREQNYPTQVLGNWREMTDIVTPDFKARQSRGELVNSPMTSYSIVETATPCQAEYYRVSDNGWSEGVGNCPLTFFGSPNIPGPLLDVLAEAEAVNEAHAGVSPSNSMTFVTLMEIEQTKRMFTEFGSLCAGLKNSMVVAMNALRLKRNKRGDQIRALKALADAWLTGRYGALPLYYDIRGTIEALQKPHVDRQTSRGWSKVTDHVEGEVVSNWRGTRGYKYTIKRETHYRAGVVYDNLMTASDEMFSRLGLSGSDAFTVPWELTRLSFVLDWMIDVGTWLRAVTPKSGVKQVLSYYSRRSTVELTAGPLTVNCTEPGWVGVGGEGSWHRVETYYERMPYAVPTIPGYGSGMNLNRSLDAAMLSINGARDFLRWASKVNLTHKER